MLCFVVVEDADDHCVLLVTIVPGQEEEEESVDVEEDYEDECGDGAEV